MFEDSPIKIPVQPIKEVENDRIYDQHQSNLKLKFMMQQQSKKNLDDQPKSADVKFSLTFSKK